MVNFTQLRAVSVFVGLSLATPSHADFVGKLILEPDGCREKGECILGDNFGYIDKRNIGWEADKGDKTDGASIPRWAQIFVGEPFEPTYLPAAVLHDHYSKSVRPVRGWYQTQVMFHEVLIASGVSKEKAALLFAGVLIGSGKWVEAEAGKPCPTLQGFSCINVEGETKTVLVTQEPIFGSEEYKQSFAKLTDQIITRGINDPIPIVEIARELAPGNIFLENTGGVVGGAQEF